MSQPYGPVLAIASAELALAAWARSRLESARRTVLLRGQLLSEARGSMTRTALTSAPLHPLLSERWSPRGFDAGHRLPERQLTALLEAARWSPSANNAQPWRFVVAQRGEAAFERLVSTLSGNTRRWAGRAGALLLVLAETTDETGTPRAYGLYDTGQAVAHLVTQAEAEGLSTHQMGGFDKAEAV